VNLPTAFLASFVVSQFDDSIRHYPSLAAMMPIVAGWAAMRALKLSQL
jgi:Mg/Co/Ni transporter MgtE